MIIYYFKSQYNNKELKNMNITLHSQFPGSKLQKSSSPSDNVQFQKSIRRQQPQPPFYSHCPGFVFSNCQVLGDRVNTEQNQVLEDYEKIKYSRDKEKDVERAPKLHKQQSKRKYKICLSLRHSQQKQKYQTPKKRAFSKDVSKKCHTQSGNQFIFSKQEQGNNSNQKQIVPLNRKFKIKTEPVEKGKPLEINMHQLKESLKPTTNITTPAHRPSKQSNNSSSKKVQLTISSNFKSSITNKKKQTYSKLCPTSFTGKRIQSSFKSQQLYVQESFMTAKLKNIYGEINNSSMQQHPSSNILCYNQIMANQALWKHQQALSYNQIKKEQSVQPSTEKVNPSQVKKRVVIKNTSILHNIEDEQQKDKMIPSEGKQKVDIRDKFMQRKYIGEYARTIKTFNQSEFKSEHESIVIEHGIPTGFLNFIINRGSIKDYPHEPQSQTIKREYSSFGQDYQNSHQIIRQRYRQYVSAPIEQSSSDSESKGE